jgi:hypothetical protein
MSEWKDVVRNSLNYQWKVVASRVGQSDIVQEVSFLDTVGAGGLIVSTVEPCHVLIPSKTIPHTTARIRAFSNHLFVSVSEGRVRWGDLQLGTDDTRFDGSPLTFGEYRVTIAIGSEQDGTKSPLARIAALE